MKALKYVGFVLAAVLVFAACQKEFSFESGLSGLKATGSLKDSLGDCQPITVKGSYAKDVALTDSNNVTIQINFASPGTYKVASDTVNGYFFKDSGYMANTGVQNITLKGYGKPILTQTNTFTVTFDTTFCIFSVTVTDTPTSPIVIPTTSGDYFPTSSYSNWTYQESSAGDTFRVSVLNPDATIAGNTYRQFRTSNIAENISDTAFYRKGGGLYYQYSNTDDFYIYDTVENKVDYIFLKDNVPQNSTWSSPDVKATLSSVTGKAKINFTIIGKDIQTTIGTTVIDSVIQVRREYMFAPAGVSVYQNLGAVDFFYAKNLGFIKVESVNFNFGIYINRWEIYY